MSRLGLLFLLVLALTVTGAAQAVGTLLVLSLAITPGAAAQRLTASPFAVAGLSTLFALAAADGGLLVSFEITTVKASVFITRFSFAIYVLARVAGPALRRHRPSEEEASASTVHVQGATSGPQPAAAPAGAAPG